MLRQPPVLEPGTQGQHVVLLRLAAFDLSEAFAGQPHAHEYHAGNTGQGEQDLADQWQIPDTYISEMMTKFVTGQEPLANWDQYINQLKKFGLDSWEEAHQMAYERFLSF